MRFLIGIVLSLALNTAQAHPHPKVYAKVSETDIKLHASSIGFFDPTLIVAIARVESSYRARVVSWYKGLPYYGMMQMSMGTARMLGYSGHGDGLLNWRTNVRYAAKYLTLLKEKHGTVRRTVAAYNAGTVYMRGKHFVNENYVRKVMKAHQSLQCVEIAVDD